MAARTTVIEIPTEGKCIRFDRLTKDYSMYLDGEYVGSAETHHAAETELDALVYDRGAELAAQIADEQAARDAAAAEYISLHERSENQECDPDYLAFVGEPATPWQCATCAETDPEERDPVRPESCRSCPVRSVTRTETHRQIVITWYLDGAFHGISHYTRTEAGARAAERKLARLAARGYTLIDTQVLRDAAHLASKLAMPLAEALKRALDFYAATEPDATDPAPMPPPPTEGGGGDDPSTGPYADPDDICQVDLAALSAVVDGWAIVRQMNGSVRDPNLAQLAAFTRRAA